MNNTNRTRLDENMDEVAEIVRKKGVTLEAALHKLYEHKQRQAAGARETQEDAQNP